MSSTVDGPEAGGESQPRTRRGRGARTNVAPFVMDDSWLLLHSSQWYASMADVRDDPTTMALAVEDACWQIAVLDWRKRKPSALAVAARRRWIAERSELATRQARLAVIAGHLRAVCPDMQPARGRRRP